MEDNDKDLAALLLLAEYDQLKRRLRAIEHPLNVAAAEYGRRKGVWGFSANHLRSAVEREREKREKAA